MENEWFDVAYINFDKAILHGRMQLGRDKFGVNQEQQVEIVLSENEKAQLYDLNEAHEKATRKLFRKIAASRYDEPGFGT